MVRQFTAQTDETGAVVLAVGVQAFVSIPGSCRSLVEMSEVGYKRSHVYFPNEKTRLTGMVDNAKLRRAAKELALSRLADKRAGMAPQKPTMGRENNTPWAMRVAAVKAYNDALAEARKLRPGVSRFAGGAAAIKKAMEARFMGSTISARSILRDVANDVTEATEPPSEGSRAKVPFFPLRSSSTSSSWSS
jgi:hypothetical protein